MFMCARILLADECLRSDFSLVNCMVQWRQHFCGAEHSRLDWSLWRVVFELFLWAHSQVFDAQFFSSENWFCQQNSSKSLSLGNFWSCSNVKGQKRHEIFPHESVEFSIWLHPAPAPIEGVSICGTQKWEFQRLFFSFTCRPRSWFTRISGARNFTHLVRTHFIYLTVAQTNHRSFFIWFFLWIFLLILCWSHEDFYQDSISSWSEWERNESEVLHFRESVMLPLWDFIPSTECKPAQCRSESAVSCCSDNTAAQFQWAYHSSLLRDLIWWLFISLRTFITSCWLNSRIISCNEVKKSRCCHSFTLQSCRPCVFILSHSLLTLDFDNN